MTLGLRKIPVPQKRDICERGVCLCDCDRAAPRATRLRPPSPSSPVGEHTRKTQLRARVGDTRPRLGILRVEREGLLKTFEGRADPCAALVQHRASLQIQLISLHIRRRSFDQFRVSDERDLQPRHDRTRDLVLHVEDIGKLAVVPIGPEWNPFEASRAVPSPYAIACPPHAAFKDMTYIEPLGNPACRLTYL